MAPGPLPASGRRCPFPPRPAFPGHCLSQLPQFSDPLQAWLNLGPLSPSPTPASHFKVDVDGMLRLEAPRGTVPSLPTVLAVGGSCPLRVTRQTDPPTEEARLPPGAPVQPRQKPHLPPPGPLPLLPPALELPGVGNTQEE